VNPALEQSAIPILRAGGLIVEGGLVYGKDVRVPTDGKERRRDGWYRAYPDVVHWQNHRTGDKGSVFPGGDVDPIERERLAAESARLRDRQRKARAAERAEAIRKAVETYFAAEPAGRPPYIVGKGLEHAHGTRQPGDTVLVLGRDADGRPAFLQRIGPDGTKRTEKGTSFVGAFVTFGTPTDDGTLVIGTGWATCAVIREETGHVVVAAMCDSNLERVARIMRDKYPDADIVVAGDDDRQNARNGGREAATAAARAIGARLAFPATCNACDGSCSDFADIRACERRRAGGDR